MLLYIQLFFSLLLSFDNSAAALYAHYIYSVGTYSFLQSNYFSQIDIYPPAFQSVFAKDIGYLFSFSHSFKVQRTCFRLVFEMQFENSLPISDQISSSIINFTGLVFEEEKITSYQFMAGFFFFVRNVKHYFPISAINFLTSAHMCRIVYI